MYMEVLGGISAACQTCQEALRSITATVNHSVIHSFYTVDGIDAAKKEEKKDLKFKIICLVIRHFSHIICKKLFTYL